MNGNAIVYPGNLPAGTPNLGKLDLAYVQPIPDARHHWSSRQLTPGKLTGWKDRVSGTVITPPTPGQGPLVYNGMRKVVRFGGSPERMGVPLDLTGPVTMAIVAVLTDQQGTNRHLTYGYDNGTFWNIYEGSNGNWAFTAGKTLSSNKPADLGRHVFLVSYDGPNTVFRVDDEEWAGDAGSTPAAGIRLGASASVYYKSDIEAIVVLPFAADKARRDSLTSQLKREHGFVF